MTKIVVACETLTDGSLAFNVRVGGEVWHAVTERDAYTLADILLSALARHTVDEAEVVYSI